MGGEGGGVLEVALFEALWVLLEHTQKSLGMRLGGGGGRGGCRFVF